MGDQPASPFSGLDKALIRSTSNRSVTGSAEPSALPTESTEEASRSSPPRSSRTREHSFERSDERTKIRHSFDIYQDQLLALSDIQADMFRQTGKKPKVGDLVQQALDVYIAKDRERTK